MPLSLKLYDTVPGISDYSTSQEPVDRSRKVTNIKFGLVNNYFNLFFSIANQNNINFYVKSNRIGNNTRELEKGVSFIQTVIFHKEG